MDGQRPENGRRRAGAAWIAAAAASGAVAVIAGAFAAHGLDRVADADAIGWLRTGSQYQAVHALAMLAVCALADRLGPRLATAARALFLAGSVLFAGALYALALHGPRWLGAVAPVGGTSLILGWLALAAAALLYRSEPRASEPKGA